MDDTRLFVPGVAATTEAADALGLARGALVGRRKLRFRYADAKGGGSARTVRPLGIFFWGKTWTLAAWCELRTDFRNFRLDRMAETAVLEDRFTDEPGCTLQDMLEQYGPEAVRLLCFRAVDHRAFSSADRGRSANVPSLCNPFSLKDWPLQKSSRTQPLSLLYPTMRFPSRNQTGWACQTLFSASGSAPSISSARRWQIARSPGVCVLLYFFVSGCI